MEIPASGTGWDFSSTVDGFLPSLPNKDIKKINLINNNNNFIQYKLVAGVLPGFFLYKIDPHLGNKI